METVESNPLITRSAVLSLYNQLIQYWNEGKGNSFASLFSDNACFIDADGTCLYGIDEIRRFAAVRFAGSVPVKFITIIRETRIISEEAGLLVAVAGKLLPGRDELDPHTHLVQSLVASGEGGDYRISLFQNTAIGFGGHSSLADNLTHELEKRMT